MFMHENDVCVDVTDTYPNQARHDKSASDNVNIRLSKLTAIHLISIHVKVEIIHSTA